MSKAMLLLVQSKIDGLSFFDVKGESILQDLPFKVHVLTNKRNIKYFDDLGTNISYDIVQWHNQIAIDQQVDDVLSKSEYFSVATLDENLVDYAAKVREKLGIGGASFDEAICFRDKVKMKNCLAEKNIRVPEYIECKHSQLVFDLLSKVEKIVIKPRSGLGASGVAVIDNIDALKAWYNNNEKLEDFEAEEFIEGTLYHVNSIVSDGKILLTVSAPYLPGLANIDFTSGAPFVTVTEDDETLKVRLEKYAEEVINVFGMQNGVTHLEVFLTEKSELVFCEIASRPGGGGIVQMMEIFSGVNFSKALILLEAGMPELISGIDEIEGVSGLVGFRNVGNQIANGRADEELFSDPWIKLFKSKVNKGDFLVPSAHCTDYIGLVILQAANYQSFIERKDELSKRFYNSLKLEAVV